MSDNTEKWAGAMALAMLKVHKMLTDLRAQGVIDNQPGQDQHIYNMSVNGRELFHVHSDKLPAFCDGIEFIYRYLTVVSAVTRRPQVKRSPVDRMPLLDPNRPWEYSGNTDPAKVTNVIDFTQEKKKRGLD